MNSKDKFRLVVAILGLILTIVSFVLLFLSAKIIFLGNITSGEGLIMISLTLCMCVVGFLGGLVHGWIKELEKERDGE